MEFELEAIEHQRFEPAPVYQPAARMVLIQEGQRDPRREGEWFTILKTFWTAFMALVHGLLWALRHPVTAFSVIASILLFPVWSVCLMRFYGYGVWIVEQQYRFLERLVFDELPAPPPPPPTVGEMLQFYALNWLPWLACLVTAVNVMVYMWPRRKAPVYWGPFQAERMVVGSQFYDTAPPPFQCTVEVFIEGIWYHSGAAFRTPNGIYTAGHVLCGVEAARLVKGTSVQEFPLDAVVTLDIDVSVIPLEYAPNGLRSCKFASACLGDDTFEMVTISGGSKSSVGPLRPNRDFGMLSYEGSTTNGFSGAPYYCGNRVYGIHIGHSSVNYGYEIGYVELVRNKNEDSEDWYLAKIQKGYAHQIKISPYDPDEIFVKIGGHYMAVDKQRYYDAKDYENDYEPDFVDYMQCDEVEIASMQKQAKSKGRKFQHRPVQLETAKPEPVSEVALPVASTYDDKSGNVKLPAVVVSTAAGPSQVMNGCVLESSTLASHETTLMSLKDSLRVVLDHLESMRAQRNQVSASTSGSILKLRDQQQQTESPPPLNLSPKVKRPSRT